MPPLPDQIRFFGYVPRDLYETFAVNRQLYIQYGKPVPFHTFWWDGNQYQTSYDDPYSAALIYVGTETSQIEEAGGFVSGTGAQAVVTFPQPQGTQIVTQEMEISGSEAGAAASETTSPAIEPTQVVPGGAMLAVGLALIAAFAFAGRK